MAIRVAHIGTGNVGRIALDQLISDPRFEMIDSHGAIDRLYEPELADAGPLVNGQFEDLVTVGGTR